MSTDLDAERLVNEAMAWAIAKVHSTDYRFLCLAFLEDAYELGGNIELDGQGSTAKESADAYGARDEGAPPPKGAYVYYDCWGEIKGDYRNWGHVGLSLGDGRVVHAWNEVRVDDYRAVEHLTPAPGWTQPTYIGWAPVSAILKGMRKR